MTDADHINVLVNKARELPSGPVRIAMLEEAVEAADFWGDMDWRFFTRYELIQSAFEGGEPDKMLVALSWCLAQCDARGTCFNPTYLLWGCKFALSYITAFPHITREQIHSLEEQAVARYQKSGASPRAPYVHVMNNHLSMGYPTEAATWRRLWRTAPRDEFAEPADWERYFEASYQRETGNSDAAIDIGMPLLDGREPNRGVDFWMANLLLLELLKRGQRRWAIDAHRRAYQQCSTNPKYVAHTGTHLLFAMLTGNVTRAAGMLEKHLPWALTTCVVSARFTFCLCAWVALQHWDRTAPRKYLRLRLPESFPLWHAGGDYSSTLLADWFAAQARELEGRFNERNGTAHYSKIVKDTLDSAQWAADWQI